MKMISKKLEIDVDSDSVVSLCALDVEKLEKCLEYVWNYLPSTMEKMERCRFSLSLVDKDYIKDVNGKYRGFDDPTDVLSFPLWEEEGVFVPPNHLPVVELGDVLVCPEVVRENAGNNGNSYEEELLLVVIHGFLHLIGLDHREEKEKEFMWSLQNKLIDKYKKITS